MHKILRIQAENAMCMLQNFTSVFRCFKTQRIFACLFKGLKSTSTFNSAKNYHKTRQFEITGRGTDDPNNSVLSKKAEGDSKVSLFNDAKDVQTKSF